VEIPPTTSDAADVEIRDISRVPRVNPFAPKCSQREPAQVLSISVEGEIRGHFRKTAKAPPRSPMPPKPLRASIKKARREEGSKRPPLPCAAPNAVNVGGASTPSKSVLALAASAPSKPKKDLAPTGSKGLKAPPKLKPPLRIHVSLERDKDVAPTKGPEYPFSDSAIERVLECVPESAPLGTVMLLKDSLSTLAKAYSVEFFKASLETNKRYEEELVRLRKELDAARASSSGLTLGSPPRQGKPARPAANQLRRGEVTMPPNALREVEHQNAQGSRFLRFLQGGRKGLQRGKHLLRKTHRPMRCQTLHMTTMTHMRTRTPKLLMVATAVVTKEGTHRRAIPLRGSMSLRVLATRASRRLSLATTCSRQRSSPSTPRRTRTLTLRRGCAKP